MVVMALGRLTSTASAESEPDTEPDEKDLDRLGEESFPASDPPPTGGADNS